MVVVIPLPEPPFPVLSVPAAPRTPAGTCPTLLHGAVASGVRLPDAGEKRPCQGKETSSMESQWKENMFSSKQDQDTTLVLTPTPSFFI